MSVRITVSQNDRYLRPEADGYLGTLSLESVLLEVQVVPGQGIYGLTVDGRKKVCEKRDWSGHSGQRLYQTKIPIMIGRGGIAYTPYPQNHFRLLRLEEGGTFDLWEIAVVSQGGHFFRTIQTTYKGCAYREEGHIVCPSFENWPQMLVFLEELVAGNINGLRPVDEYRPEPEPSAEGLSPDQGRVSWYNLAYGMGAIVTPRGSARVHWSQVPGRPRLAFLVPGERVEFESLRTPETGKRGTRFQWEARGIRPIE